MTDNNRTRTTEEPLKIPQPIGAQTNQVKPVSSEVQHSKLIANGDFGNISVASIFLQTPETNPARLMDALHEQAEAIHQGDMSQVESMLMGQAVALQCMFAEFALRVKTAQSLPAIQCLAQLALRSQAGSRNALQTLADIKNPRQVAFVKQTNFAQTQQVNNGVRIPSRAENMQAEPNKLLVEDSHGSTKMDTRAKTTAGRAHKDLVPVEQINRADKPRGKAKRVP